MAYLAGWFLDHKISKRRLYEYVARKALPQKLQLFQLNIPWSHLKYHLSLTGYVQEKVNRRAVTNSHLTILQEVLEVSSMFTGMKLSST
jgi:hypothetical protein